MITSINEYKLILCLEHENINESFKDQLKSMIDEYSNKSEAFNKIVNVLQNVPKSVYKKIMHGLILAFLSFITIDKMIDVVYTNANTEFAEEFKRAADLINTNNVTKKMEDNVKSKVQTYSKNLINFLKWEEGQIKKKGEPVLTAYKLGDGMVTIGYGHAEPISKSKYIPGVSTITKEEAEELLIQDIESKHNAVQRMLRDWKKDGVELNLTQNMYDMIVSMVYNMGATRFRNTEFAKLLKQNKMKEAAELIPVTAVGKWEGVRRRRLKEYKIFTSNDTNIFNTIHK